MYAIIQTGGKQFRVSEGDVIYVEKLEAQDGDELNFETLLIAGEGEPKVGSPLLTQAVKGVCRGQVKGKKIMVYKYKAKKNERKKQGHRQPYTRVEITQIPA